MNPQYTIITKIGRRIIDGLSSLGAGALILADACRGIYPANARLRKRLLAQMALVGFESLSIVVITSLFGGMVLGLHTAKQFVRFGAGQYVGGVVAVSIARELGPTLTAIVVAARIGSAFAAELGSMKITNQIDALRALAANPVHYLVTPRLLASAIMLPVLTMYANVMGIAGGAIVAMNAGVSYPSFINAASQFTESYDIGGGLFKTIIFGIIIAITSCYVGLTTEGGAAGVGRSTTAAVVWSIVLIYVSNFLMSWLIWAFRG